MVLAAFRQPIAQQLENNLHLQGTTNNSRWMDWLPNSEWSPGWRAGFEEMLQDFEDGRHQGSVQHLLAEWSKSNGGQPRAGGFTVTCPCGRNVRGHLRELKQLVDPKFAAKKRVVSVSLHPSVT